MAEGENPTVSEKSEAISWTASEYIAHHKNIGWYFGLTAATIAASALLWLLTKDFLTSAVVVICGLALGAYAGRQPRTLTYTLDRRGLSIGERFLPYEHFKSFAIVPEGHFTSIVLMPLKRFSPMTTLYYPPEQEDEIVTHLAEFLPLEERKPDPIDRLMYRIRF